MTNLLRFVFSGLLLVSSAQAKKLETVNPITIQKLRLSFRTASKKLYFPLHKKWNCKLYGVRSKTFTLNKSDFFDFSPKSDKYISNNGAQVIKNYNVFSRGLWGKKENIYENIRQLADGRLITEISKPNHTVNNGIKSGNYASLAFSKHAVLAYGICNKNI